MFQEQPRTTHQLHAGNQQVLARGSQGPLREAGVDHQTKHDQKLTYVDQKTNLLPDPLAGQ
jgi:hypothetical protein